MNSSLKYLGMATMLAGLAGCASVDFDYPKTESTVILGTSDTYLGEQLKRLLHLILTCKF